MADFAIRNALIVDGTGKLGFYGSVAVKGDKIVEVGTITSPGSFCIDAEGLVLVPGIIDSHTHFDAQITWDPMVSHLLRMALPPFLLVIADLRSLLVSQNIEI